MVASIVTNRKVIFREENAPVDNILINTKLRGPLEFVISLCAFGFLFFVFLMQNFYGGNKMVAKEKVVDVIYLDSQWAFDEVLHRRLLRKLDEHWVRGKGLSIRS